MNLVIGIAMFITIILLIEGSYFALTAVHNPEQRRLRRRLRTLSSGGNHGVAIDIVRKRVFSDVPWLNRIILKTPGVQPLGRLLEQANTRYSLGTFLLFSLVLVFMGFLLSILATKNALLQMSSAAVLGMAPFLYVYQRKQQRMAQFQRQLPDALDLVARALKAGHSFLAGMKMAADEFADPLGVEFDKTIDEINFGGDVPEALKNLTQRVDSPDLKFFVTAVIVQRETGGNLAEIIENISQLIRKRFELHGRIRVLAAEGKLSAIILLGLPFLVGGAIAFLNPHYLGVLFTDPLGRGMMAFSGFMMAIGAVMITKMVRIKV